MAGNGLWRSGDVVAFTAMAVLEFTKVGLTILYKAATLKGLNFLVYITYAHAFGALLLLPLSFIISRRGVPWFKLSSVLYKIILLSLISFLARIFGFKGIEYSSPALSSSINTITPGFTFILAVIFRMEKFDLRNSNSRAKIVGTLVSVLGALVMVLFKGPIIFSSSISSKISSPFLGLSSPRTSSPTSWAIGGLLLFIDMLLNAEAYILQTQIMKIYPNELVVVFMKCLFVTILALPLSSVVERDLSVWALKPDITLIATLYSVFFGPAFIATVNCFCLHLKGPLYVAIFMPLAVVISTAGSFIFLGDAIHLGSVIGAIILLIGFYAVLSGKAKEEKSEDYISNIYNIGSDSSNEKTPLLQSYIDK